MSLPIIGNLLGGSKTPEKILEEQPVRISTNIPNIQPGQLASYEVIKEAAKTNQLSKEWKVKYRGFDLDNAAPFGNIPAGYETVMRAEFEIQQEVLYNFTPVDTVFDDDYCDRRLECIQDGVVVQAQFSKAINSNFTNRALGSYTNNKTEISAGGIQQQRTEKKGGLLSFFMR